MKTWKKVLLGVCAAGCAFVAVVAIMASSMGKDDRICDNVFVGKVDVSRKTWDEAAQALNASLDDFLDTAYEFDIADDSITITPRSIDAQVNVTDAVNEAFTVGRTGNIFQKVFADHTLNMPFSYDKEKLIAILNPDDSARKTIFELDESEIKVTNGSNLYSFDVDDAETRLIDRMASMDTAPLYFSLEPMRFIPLTIDDIVEAYPINGGDAYYAKDENGVVYVEPEKIGVSFDEQIVKATIAEHTAPKEVYSIPVTVEYPSITAEILTQKLYSDTLSSYTTHFSEGDANRSSNIRKASANINAHALLPGEAFSYNETVGERTADNGFLKAHAYVDGDVVDQYGGGICQVSSTLYNATLLANLQITERTCHMMTVGYVPIGRDATVDWGHLDFKFVNNREYPIKIQMDTSVYGALTVTIYGTKTENEPTVDLVVSNVSYHAPGRKTVNNAELPVGTERIVKQGKSTITCDLYRVLKVNGEEISSTKEASSRYRGSEEIVEVGTGENVAVDPSAGDEPAPVSSEETPVYEETPAVQETVPEYTEEVY